MKLVALSQFTGTVTWMGRSVSVVDARTGVPAGAAGPQVLVGDTRVVLEVLRRNPGADLRPLLLDSEGPGDLSAAAAAVIRAYPRAQLVYAVRAHGDAYVARGLPRDRVTHVPASLQFFPLMLPGFSFPTATWEPASPPRLSSGGRVWRDYDTLRLVADELRMPVDVVTDTTRVTVGASPFVHVSGVLPFDEFCAVLVRSAATLIPLVANGRNAGQATIVLAMHLGVPIVASDSPAVREYVTPQETGLLVPPAEPRAMAAAVRRLLADRALTQRLTEAARAAAAGFEAQARSRLETALAWLEA